MKTESRTVVMREKVEQLLQCRPHCIDKAHTRENGEWCHGSRVSVWDDENVPKIDGGDAEQCQCTSCH